MKLRNKKTGEIRNAVDIDMYTDSVYLKMSDGAFGIGTIEYHSLAELNEEWEDYEKPKDDYIRVIESFIHYVEEADESFDCDDTVQKFVKELKAWKRLKVKGFKFDGLQKEHKELTFNIAPATIKFNKGGDFKWFLENKDDLFLLFGGEE